MGEGLMAPIGVFPQGTVTHLSSRPARRGCAAPFCKHTQPLGTPKLVPGAGTCREGRRKRSDLISSTAAPLLPGGAGLLSGAGHTAQGGGDTVCVCWGPASAACWGNGGQTSPRGEQGGRCSLRLPTLHIPGSGSLPCAPRRRNRFSFPAGAGSIPDAGKGMLLEGLLPHLTVAVPLQDRCLRRRPGRTGRAAARGCPRPCA